MVFLAAFFSASMPAQEKSLGDEAANLFRNEPVESKQKMK
jgi:hypothetical protein